MAPFCSFFFLLLFFFHHSPLLPSTFAHLLSIVTNNQDSNAGTLRIRTYIIHVQKPDTDLLSDIDRTKWHQSFLPNATLDSGEPRLVYSYRHAISGFAARLTDAEVASMASNDGFLQATPDEILIPLTTYSPDFLGLSGRYGVWYQNSFGSGVVIGVLDTGIRPTHPSFSDRGMSLPPMRWDGNCDFHGCNKKVIGMSAFHHGRPTSIDDDEDGHGTHVASIIAGNYVDEARVLGNANGTSVGMAPKGHLAIYKVCSEDGCHDSDVLAGIDQAIHDEVDVLSISIGSARPRPLYEDSIAIGTFAANRRRILASVAAGNDGPGEGTVVNDAPWALTVGAATMDRRIMATLRLENGTELVGESASEPNISPNSSVWLPIAFPGYNSTAKGCRNDSLAAHMDIKGKMVLCETGYNISNIDKGEVVKRFGGAAMVLLNNIEQGLTTFSEPHVLPAIHLNFSDSLKIVSYFNSSSERPLAAIMFNGTKFGAPRSPAVAYFSSRGPSTINGGILKPDIIAPGVNILAAWPTSVGPNYTEDSPTFNFASGTSIAAAHVSGIVALLKSTRTRRWSPAAFKSAITTTADISDDDGEAIIDQSNAGAPAHLFARGAGHVNASRANDPGLIYDLRAHHYIHYLCGLGYTDRQVKVITQHHAQCSKSHEISPEDLNHPSIALTIGSPGRKMVKRKVKNVGEAKSVYLAEIQEPEGVSVEVTPFKLEFSKHYERKHFHVIFTTNSSTIRPSKGHSQGQLTWVSETHTVRSPISVTFT